jgi:tetratricopeptide (TPR) repeat protein
MLPRNLKHRNLWVFPTHNESPEGPVVGSSGARSISVGWVRVGGTSCRGRPVPPKKIRFTGTPPQLLLLICSLLVFAAVPAVASSGSDHLELAAELLKAGDADSAEKQARLALADSSARPMAWEVLGVIRARQKRYAEATDFLNKALQLDPSLLKAREALGEVYVLSGKKAAARESFETVLRADPKNLEARFALVELESASHNYSKSLSAAEPVVDSLRQDPDGILALAADYAGLQQKEELLTLVKAWTVLPDVSGDSAVKFASLLTKLSLEQQAIEVLERAKDSGQVSFDLAFDLANLYFSKGDLDRAFSSYEGALSLHPSCTRCSLQLAAIATQQKDPEKALAYLIKAKREQPDNSKILFEFGKTCLELDLPDDAIPVLQKAVALEPKNDKYQYVLASANVAKKQYEAAGKIFHGLLTKHPDDPVLNYAMGSLLFLEVKLDEAETYLRRSIEGQPDQTAPFYYLALIAEGKGENDRAVGILRDLLGHAPQYGLAYEALGEVLLKQRKYPEAQEALEKAVSLNPDSVKAHYQLGILWGRAGKPEEANKEFEVVQRLNAEDSERLGKRLRILSPH